MRTTTRSLGSVLVVAALALTASCGGDDELPFDDLDDLDDIVDESETNDTNDDANDDANSDDNDDQSADGPGFGNFESGEIVLTGAEEATYAVGDPALGFVSGGGCGGENYGISVNVQNAEGQFTMAQISADIDEDMSGGRTGTFPVEEVSLLMIPDGDMAAARTYEGPGTLDVIEHDNAAPDFDLNERRTVLSITGTLEANGADDEPGTVELDADLVWIMGCP